MFNPRRVSSHSPFELGRVFVFILYPVGLFYRIWLKTIRFESVNEGKLKELTETDKPVIITLWHNRLFLAGEWQRRFRKKRKCYGLISASRDGAWLERFYAWSGIYAIRGSGNRSGPRAIRLLVKKLKANCDIGITPDGSRGPCYVAKPGALFVAKVSKMPILLLSFEFGKHIKLNSWDRFVIPLPFSKVRVHYNVMIWNQSLKDLPLEGATKLLTDKINDITID